MMQLLHSEPGGQRHSSIAEKQLLWRVCQQYWQAPNGSSGRPSWSCIIIRMLSIPLSIKVLIITAEVRC